MTAALFSLEMVNGLQYAISAGGRNSDMSISGGTLLQVLQLAIFVLSAFFSLFVMFVLRIIRRDVGDEKLLDFDGSLKASGSEDRIIIG